MNLTKILACTAALGVAGWFGFDKLTHRVDVSYITVPETNRKGMHIYVGRNISPVTRAGYWCHEWEGDVPQQTLVIQQWGDWKQLEDLNGDDFVDTIQDLKIRTVRTTKTLKGVNDRVQEVYQYFPLVDVVKRYASDDVAEANAQWKKYTEALKVKEITEKARRDWKK